MRASLPSYWAYTYGCQTRLPNTPAKYVVFGICVCIAVLHSTHFLELRGAMAESVRMSQMPRFPVGMEVTSVDLTGSVRGFPTWHVTVGRGATLAQLITGWRAQHEDIGVLVPGNTPNVSEQYFVQRPMPEDSMAQLCQKCKRMPGGWMTVRVCFKVVVHGRYFTPTGSASLALQRVRCSPRYTVAKRTGQHESSSDPYFRAE